jgi:hypothetical protein
VIVVLLVLGVVGSTCAFPAPTSTPLPPGTVFNDDFSTNNGMWGLFDTSEGAVYLQQSELYLEDRGQGVGVYTQLSKHRWDDLTMTTRVRQVDGTQDNWMGAICRQQDEENYYLMAISADGYYLILKTEAGIPTTLLGPEKSDVINPGRATNTLQARCVGETLALYVNEEALASVQDDSFEAGSVALFADGVAGQYTTVAFDALVISEP